MKSLFLALAMFASTNVFAATVELGKYRANLKEDPSVTANFELIPPVALEVLPVVTPTPAPVVEEPTAAAPAPLILPQAVVATTKTACDKPILIDLSKNIAADGSSKVEISSLPKTGTLVQTSATTWTFTPAKNSCSLGGNDSIVFKITDKIQSIITLKLRNSRSNFFCP